MSGFLSRWYHHVMWISFICFLFVTEGLDGTFCGGKFVELTATTNAQYLSFPTNGSYPNNCRRNWRITSSHDLVKLYILDINLEKSDNCRYDALTIYDGYSSNNRELAKLCQRSISNALTYSSTSTNVNLEFKSDGSVTGKGFLIAYTNDLGSFCEGEVVKLTATANVQYLTFPPSGNYTSNCRYNWRITSSHDFVKLYILDINLENSENCRYDALTIYDGYNSNNRQLAKLCQRSISDAITYSSTSTNVNLKFKSNGSLTGKGFLIAYTNDLGSFCDGEVLELTATANVQYLTFPTRGNYTSNCQRNWRFRSSHDFVKLYILDMDLETSENCHYDALTIYNGNAQSFYPKLAKLCEMPRYQSLAFKSTSTKLFLKFKSDGSGTGKGFRIAYTNDKGESVPPEVATTNLFATVNVQYLTFPTVGNYINNVIVQWRISSSMYNQTLKIVVVSLDIEDGYDCQFDALTIYDGFDSKAPELAKLCNQLFSSYQTIFRSRSEYLFLRFNSNENVQRRGFKIQYTIERYDPTPVTSPTQGTFCQDETVELTATADVQHLLFPTDGNYPNNCRRNWRITSSHDLVKLYIWDFDLETSVTCQFDALAIYDGFDSNSPELTRLCGQLSNLDDTSFESSSQYFFLRFTSDDFSQGRGFKIRYTSSDSLHHPDVTDSETQSSDKAGLIAGIVGGVCVLLLIVILVFFIMRRKHLPGQRRHPQRRRADTRASATPNNQNVRHGRSSNDVNTVSSSVTPPLYPTLNQAFVQDEPPPSNTEHLEQDLQPVRRKDIFRTNSHLSRVSYSEVMQHTVYPSAPPLYPHAE